MIEIVRYYAREAGLKTARRFLTQAETTFQKLAEMPGRGVAYEAESPVFAGIFFSPIIGFKSYLAFYRSCIDGIEIIRVLHGARDIGNILADEFGMETEGGS
ncbi:MAG TPA: type II toxin-antitoxin system RelE/ParE family toxin [Gemmataceae bacterium]|nr:type II toxin-antitoxin system RelE/ParE family toxin [Gemmataceae bacterium]